MNFTKLIAGLAAIVPMVLGGGLADAADPVKIGYSIAKTGLFSQAAPSQITAYELWAEQVNAAGGLDVAARSVPWNSSGMMTSPTRASRRRSTRS